MALQQGTYTITSLSGCRIGLGIPENGPSQLIPIVCLPDGGPLPIWKVEEVEEGFFTLRAGESPADADRGLLFAFASGDEGHLGAWKLRQPENAGSNNVFVVSKANSDNDEGWSLPDNNEMTQVEVRPLAPSSPPNEVFEFVTLNEVD